MPAPEATLTDADLALAFGDYRKRSYTELCLKDERVQSRSTLWTGFDLYKQEDYFQLARM